MKTCTVCRKTKPLEDFCRDRSRPDGRFPQCKLCHAERNRDQTTPEQRQERRQRFAQKLATNAELRERWKVKTTQWSVRHRYGLDPEQYLAMMEAQKGACAICKQVPRERHERYRQLLCVDHDHSTGATRALLCDDCNRGLGAFQDDPARLRAALRYLKKHEPPAA